MAEFAYDDTPLPIEEGQTISQPYHRGGDGRGRRAATRQPGARDRRRLGLRRRGAEPGRGRGVDDRAARASWPTRPRRRLADLGYDNVHVVCGDGTLGLPEQAPFDAIVVTAGGPVGARGAGRAARRRRPSRHPRRTRDPGPAPRCGSDASVTTLVEEDLGPVRFVPLVGEQGWAPSEDRRSGGARPRVPAPSGLGHPGPRGGRALRRRSTTPSSDRLLERIGDCPVVLLGEASHGTSEFYRHARPHHPRADPPQGLHRGRRRGRLARRRPDRQPMCATGRRPARASRRSRGSRPGCGATTRCGPSSTGSTRHNDDVPTRRVGSASTASTSTACSRPGTPSSTTSTGSIPRPRRWPAHRYGCLTPWEHDPASLRPGRRHRPLRRLRGRRGAARSPTCCAGASTTPAGRGDDFVDAAQNALVVANAERYYRIMYHGSRESWNLRDLHMFETLQTRSACPPRRDTKVVVWEHNSHVGDASATEMGARGEHNVGMLARREYGDEAFLIGFGTHDGHGGRGLRLGWPDGAQVVSARRTPTATSGSATTPAFPPSCCTCATPTAVRSATS